MKAKAEHMQRATLSRLLSLAVMTSASLVATVSIGGRGMAQELAQLTVYNQTNYTVKIFVVDSLGNEQENGQIAAAGSSALSGTNLFRFKSEDGNVLNAAVLQPSEYAKPAWNVLTLTDIGYRFPNYPTNYLSLTQYSNSFSFPGVVDKVVREVNALRTNPKSFAERLRPRLAWFNGNVMTKPGAIGLVTREGAAAVNEAINFLEAAAPLPTPLTFSPSLAGAGKLLADVQSVSGDTGHESSNGNMTQRINSMTANAPWQGNIGECCSYGYDDPFDIVAQWVIDDGTPSRGHRANLFSANFSFVGVAVATHKTYRYMCVLDLAQGFQQSADFEEKTDGTYLAKFAFVTGGTVVARFSGIRGDPQFNKPPILIRHLNGLGDEAIPGPGIIKYILPAPVSITDFIGFYKADARGGLPWAYNWKGNAYKFRFGNGTIDEFPGWAGATWQPISANQIRLVHPDQRTMTMTFDSLYSFSGTDFDGVTAISGRRRPVDPQW